jgi:hypothetical protein
MKQMKTFSIGLMMYHSNLFILHSKLHDLMNLLNFSVLIHVKKTNYDFLVLLPTEEFDRFIVVLLTGLFKY